MFRGVALAVALVASLGGCSDAPSQNGSDESFPSEVYASAASAAAITPARLAIHEDALVGISARAGLMHGSYDADGRYAGSPAGAEELDLEQDLFGAVRVVERGQLAALVPLVETRRKTTTT